jgi:predicted transcriptional regulator
MPSKSKAQHNLMAMVANDPKAAKRLGIPQSVGKDYVKADKGRKFAEGGSMKESKKMMAKEVSFMKKKGAPKSMIRHEEKEAKGYKKGGSVTRADGIVKKGHTKGKMV